MWAILAAALVAEIERRLQSGQSQRQVAKQFQVSRNTVAGIAKGTRQVRQKLSAEAKDAGSIEARQTLSVPRKLPLAQRCPCCGHFVQLPCQVCRTRRFVNGTQQAVG